MVFPETSFLTEGTIFVQLMAQSRYYFCFLKQRQPRHVSPLIRLQRTVLNCAYLHAARVLYYLSKCSSAVATTPACSECHKVSVN